MEKSELEQLAEILVGKKIIEVGFNWIKLDNGEVIYLTLKKGELRRILW